ncbi:MAG: formate dehydrogenase subunit delta [Alphaproteobacteria bacterium]|nr:formate dehydrogenase subunit delta [Alphaproteobacteria bacterium]
MMDSQPTQATDPSVKLVRMANQISDYFAAYPHDKAVKQTREHIEQFWAPPMRLAIKAHLAQGGKGLKPISSEAVGGLHPVKVS